MFTTNYVGELDPALIRRGRMDMHIEMSYLKFEAFKTLAMNYLQMEDHPLFETIKELLEEVEIAPADVAECLMVSRRTDHDAYACLNRLIGELKKKKGESMEINNKNAKTNEHRNKAKAKAKAKRKAKAKKEKVEKAASEDDNKTDDNTEKKTMEVEEDEEEEGRPSKKIK